MPRAWIVKVTLRGRSYHFPTHVGSVTAPSMAAAAREGYRAAMRALPPRTRVYGVTITVEVAP